MHVTDVVGFLESLGSRSQDVSSDAYAAEVAALQIDEAQREALTLRDVALLSEAMGGRAAMMCMIWAPDQEPAREDENLPDGDEQGEEESPQE